MFLDWCREWLDVDEAHPEDQFGLAGVVHSVIPVRPRRVKLGGPEYDVSVDFGSAPITALTELLDLAFALGATEVVLGSPEELTGFASA